MKSKFCYPKCPYCGFEYKGSNMSDYTLCKLAVESWHTEAVHKCEKCGNLYAITVKIMYYGKKIKKKIKIT